MVFSGVHQRTLVPGCSYYCITLVTLSLEFSNISINFPRKNYTFLSLDCLRCNFTHLFEHVLSEIAYIT